MTQVKGGVRRRLGRCAPLVAVMACAAILGPAGSASASVTIGAPSLDATNEVANFNGGTYSNSLIPGAQVSSPVNGTITSWAFRAGAGGSATLRVLRFVGNNSYLFVASSTPASNTGGPHSYPTSIPIAAGDRIGLTLNGGEVAMLSDPAAVFDFWPGEPPALTPDGATVAPDSTSSGFIFLFNATIEPASEPGNAPVLANGVTVRSVARNRRRGTAVLTLGIPSAGQLTVGGGGAQVAGSLSRSIAGPGDTQVTVRASGKKRRKLNATGKVRVNLTVSFTPTGGSPGTASIPVKLRKRK